MTDTNAPVAWRVIDTHEADREVARFSTHAEALNYSNKIESSCATHWRFVLEPVRGAFA